MELKEAREIAAEVMLAGSEDDAMAEAILVLDDRITELEAIITEHDKDLPKFKDIIGLYKD